jgi:hypothetical protein
MDAVIQKRGNRRDSHYDDQTEYLNHIARAAMRLRQIDLLGK